MVTSIEIKEFMLRNYYLFLNKSYDSSNLELTKMAEYACECLDGYTDSDDIPEEFFEVAVEIAEWLDIPA